MTNDKRTYKRLKQVLLLVVVIAVAVAFGRLGHNPPRNGGFWDGPI